MRILRNRAGRARRFTVAAVAVAAALGGSTAANAAARGISVREQCATVAGHISEKPGLLSTARPMNAVLRATTTGCSDPFTGPSAGDGSFTAALKGKVRLAAENFSGTFTIRWPAGSGLNPSTGTLTVTESAGIETVNGTVTAGALAGSPIHLAFRTTASTGMGTQRHPVTGQAFASTKPLQLTETDD